MSSLSPMLRSAIRTANKLGLTLQEGAKVEASGNCLLEAVRGNVEDRDVFTKKIEESVSELRRKAAEEGELVIGSSPYRIEDFSEEEWAAGWDRLRSDRIWDVDYFGDLMIIAVAHYIRKNILIINTEQGSAPVTVILGDSLGAPLDSEYPVLVAYSGSHYESLIPVLDKDEAMARKIILKYIRGEDLFLVPSEYNQNQSFIESRNIEIKRENTSDEDSPVIQERKIEIEISNSEPERGYWDNDQAYRSSLNTSLSSNGVETWSQYHPLTKTSDTINMWTESPAVNPLFQSGKESRNLNKSLSSAFI